MLFAFGVCFFLSTIQRTEHTSSFGSKFQLMYFKCFVFFSSVFRFLLFWISRLVGWSSFLAAHLPTYSLSALNCTDCYCLLFFSVLGPCIFFIFISPFFVSFVRSFVRSLALSKTFFVCFLYFVFILVEWSEWDCYDKRI